MANPIVTIQMKDGGVMKAELYPDIAPETVKNFVYLASNGETLMNERQDLGIRIRDLDNTAYQVHIDINYRVRFAFFNGNAVDLASCYRNY